VSGRGPTSGSRSPGSSTSSAAGETSAPTTRPASRSRASATAWSRSASAEWRGATRPSRSPPGSSGLGRPASHSAPHAGETVGPASVWGALQALGAERIGHGVRAIEDPALVAYLAERQIALEVNPTSNLRLGVFPGLAEHPLPRLHAAGIPIVVGSDDPPLFNTTLEREVGLLADPFGFDVETIDEILLNGARHSFLPSDRKQALVASFQAELEALKPVHLAESGQA
jgi:hypothetical protein